MPNLAGLVVEISRTTQFCQIGFRTDQERESPNEANRVQRTDSSICEGSTGIFTASRISRVQRSTRSNRLLLEANTCRAIQAALVWSDLALCFDVQTAIAASTLNHRETGDETMKASEAFAPEIKAVLEKEGLV